MSVERDPPAWSPSGHATHVAVQGSADTNEPCAILVEHFNDPYEAVLEDIDDAGLQAAAGRYLRVLLEHPVVAERLGRQVSEVLDHWLSALDAEKPPASEPYFGWLRFEPVERSGEAYIAPYGSFRTPEPGQKALAAVLVASERLNPDHFIGSGFGLSVVAHLHLDQGKPRARFMGVSANLPHGDYRANALWKAPRERVEIFRSGLLYKDRVALDDMAAAANLERFVVRGVRLAASGARWWIERRGIGVRRVADAARYDDEASYGAEVPYFVSMLSVGGDGEARNTILHTAPLIADASNSGRVFDHGPGSVTEKLVRPTRNEKDDPPTQPAGLDPFRVSANILASGSDKLEYKAASATVRVMPCRRFVLDDKPLNATLPRPVTLATAADPSIRSEDASAVQAFFHARDLLRRMQAYGWADPGAYFHVMKPQVDIYYRSGVSPGPGKDGRTVNARVIPKGWPPEAMGQPPNTSPPPPIEMHLAWADLRRRERRPWTPGGPPSPAIPLGVGADQRWMWHEFCHVLLVASTGELEFRFAHSAGDAMAAIVGDPESKLEGRNRGLTFPFVFLPRQHDRCAAHGWSWSGTMHAELGAVPASLHPRRKGYRSEQILSSSLFRLYRCIGGDTCKLGDPADPDRDERRRASHYSLYLVMQAIELMGDANASPVATPEQFAFLLKLADTVNAQWSATYPPGSPKPFQRAGRTLCKVIRWTFEAQGLYGAGDGPGSPENVDIYIPDARPTKDDVEYGPGSYVPVSLHWQNRNMSAAPGAPPLWQADAANGMVHDKNTGQVKVRVGNRSSTPATNVSVKLWSAPWGNNQPPPEWGAPNTWTACAAVGAGTQNIPAGASPAAQPFTFTFAPASGRHVLFAQATCVDDRANGDPATMQVPLVDLAANDNNLGVLVVRV